MSIWTTQELYDDKIETLGLLEARLDEYFMPIYKELMREIRQIDSQEGFDAVEKKVKTFMKQWTLRSYMRREMYADMLFLRLNTVRHCLYVLDQVEKKRKRLRMRANLKL